MVCILKMEVSMENICRTCMSEEYDMLSLFGSVIEDISTKSLAYMLMDCTSLQVTEEDELPTKICQQCVKQLTQAFNFKRQSEEIDATLREITKNPNIEFIKDETMVDVNDLDNLLLIKSETVEDENINSIQTENACILTDADSNDENLEDVVYICDNCLHMYKAYKDFVEHQRICCRKSYTCDLCDTSFKTENDYIDHSNLHCLKSYDCKICNKTFILKDEFTKHKKTHIKLYKCKICAREFKSPHGLSYHMKIHNGIKQFSCPYEKCERQFVLKQALEKHISTHSKESTHLCYLCGKTFNTSDSLYYHIKTHEGRRPHLCVQCGKTFKQTCHLKSHMWIHNGVKPHTCETCGKCYTSGHQLKKHLKKYCNNFTIKTEN